MALKRVITLKIVVLSCLLADIRVITKFHPPSWISDFPFSSGSVIDSTIEKFDPDNMGVVVGILFLASIEAEISLVGSFTPLQHKRH